MNEWPASPFNLNSVRELLTAGQASLYLSQFGVDLAPKTLANLRSAGGGPDFRKLKNRQIRYAMGDLQTFAKLQVCFGGDSTSTLKPINSLT